MCFSINPYCQKNLKSLLVMSLSRSLVTLLVPTKVNTWVSSWSCSFKNRVTRAIPVPTLKVTVNTKVKMKFSSDMESENCVIVCLQLRKYKSHHDSSLSVTKNLQPVMVLYTYMQQHDKGSLPRRKRMNFRKSTKRPLNSSPLIFRKSYYNFVGILGCLCVKYILNIICNIIVLELF